MSGVDDKALALTGKLSFAASLTAEQVQELTTIMHEFGEVCMNYHNRRSGGKCPLCYGWGAPTGCRCCGLTCMGG